MRASEHSVAIEACEAALFSRQKGDLPTNFRVPKGHLGHGATEQGREYFEGVPWQPRGRTSEVGEHVMKVDQGSEDPTRIRDPTWQEDRLFGRESLDYLAYLLVGLHVYKWTLIWVIHLGLQTCEVTTRRANNWGHKGHAVRGLSEECKQSGLWDIYSTRVYCWVFPTSFVLLWSFLGLFGCVELWRQGIRAAPFTSSKSNLLTRYISWEISRYIVVYVT